MPDVHDCPPLEVHKEKSWVQTIEPTVKKYRLWSSFGEDLTYTMRCDELRAVADTIHTMAEQIDDYKACIDRQYARFKWVALWSSTVGYFGAQLLDYLI